MLLFYLLLRAAQFKLRGRVCVIQVLLYYLLICSNFDRLTSRMVDDIKWPSHSQSFADMGPVP